MYGLLPEMKVFVIPSKTLNMPIRECFSPGGGAPYQILAPAYYDQNGQLVMGNGRGIGTPLRLVSPAPILVNAATNGQQG